MKCISRRLAVSVLAAALFLSGCGVTSVRTEEVSSPYPVYTASPYSFRSASAGAAVPAFSDDLCVIGRENTDLTGTHYENCGGAGLFDLTTNEVRYAYNVHERLYPASTTKILTLYLAALYGNMEDTVTVSANAVDQPADSSTCDLNEGDTLTLRDLCHGMMLRSGNDAAVAIAEHLSGSVEAFADLMNTTANALGATNSHFVNPNGMPDEEHYTTVYDMYLILNAAATNETFLSVFTAQYYTANYTNALREPVTLEWKTTNPYLLETVKAPDNITVLGGKTGTTGAAGYCLVNLIQNASGDLLVSTVFKSDGRSNLYLIMNEIMGTYANPITG